MNDIRVLVVDDQALIRTGLAGILQGEPGLTVVGESSDGQQAVNFVAQGGVDVVLMDLRMPVLNGVDATRQITASTNEVAVLALTTFETEEYVLSAVRAGARGFLGKNCDADSLISAIRVVAAGGTQLSGTAMTVLAGTLTQPDEGRNSSNTRPPRAPVDQDIPPGRDLGVLTDREREVVTLVARGLSNDEIAKKLYISLHTAKTHVHRSMTKLGARHRTQLALMALSASGEPKI